MKLLKKLLPSRHVLLPLLACGFCLGEPATARENPAPTASLTIEAGTPTGKVSPMHYGLMTEEINHCYDEHYYRNTEAFLKDSPTPAGDF